MARPMTGRATYRRGPVTAAVTEGRSCEVKTHAHGGAVANSYRQAADCDHLTVVTRLVDGEITRHEIEWARTYAPKRPFGQSDELTTRVTHHGPVAERGFKTVAAAQKALAERPEAKLRQIGDRFLLELEGTAAGWAAKRWIGTAGRDAGHVPA